MNELEVSYGDPTWVFRDQRDHTAIAAIATQLYLNVIRRICWPLNVITARYSMYMYHWWRNALAKLSTLSDIEVKGFSQTLLIALLIRENVNVNWYFTPLFNHVIYGGQFSFHSCRNKLFLGVNQQPYGSNWQLPVMGFKPQRRGASSFKARRLIYSATPC